ncbi:hypothetical protein [Streptomyces katrae]|uniref:hypothetical protein n=1 Tax=Streptomyces katrae TaxID=68223 RepID=UPI00131BF58D|nr:hypothetical protein [Streptomyces katrae]
MEHLDALHFDPLLHRLVREEPVALVRMRYGGGHAWLLTRYEYVKEVTSDPRFSRALTVDRPVTGMTPRDVAAARGIGRTDAPEHTRLRRLVRNRAALTRIHHHAVLSTLLRRHRGCGLQCRPKRCAGVGAPSTGPRSRWPGESSARRSRRPVLKRLPSLPGPFTAPVPTPRGRRFGMRSENPLA